jgi:hypothetical protein
MRSVVLGLLGLMPSLNIVDDQAPADRFANEPTRPKADAPVQFARSWEQARAESTRTGRRILAVFTGEHCGWCRVLEKRTFTDLEVVQLSKQFASVAVDVGAKENARLVDEFRVDTIPRSFVLTEDGRVVSKLTGYTPAAEYARWLEEARTKSPALVQKDAPPAASPQPVGAPQAEADVTIWSVDSGRSISRWGDDDWTGHAQLLHLLGNAGLRARVEHMARENFPTRWDRAEAMGQTPEIIIADQWAGLVRDLQKQGRLIELLSQRLTWTPENASCHDFAGRMGFLVARARNEDAGRKAVGELLTAGPETGLPGSELTNAENRAEAATVAKRSAIAYMSGDAVELKAVAAPSSPQLTRCLKPEEYRRGRDVGIDSVAIRGNQTVAFAKVDVHWRGTKEFGADSVVVVLQRDASQWKAFAVSSDILCTKELSAFCRLEFCTAIKSDDLPIPRLLYPVDGAKIGDGGKSFAWDLPGEGGPFAAQVCQVLLGGENGSRWPDTRLRVYPGAPPRRTLLWSETAQDLTGVTAKEMAWCVWLIGRDGRISVSGVRKYLPPEFKY